jgi:CheY-like chemotaxis protein
MTQTALPDFMVIDDDPVNNKICSIIINKQFPGKQIDSFTDPEVGLAFISDKYASQETNNVILLLDINMPVLTGWDVLERFGKMEDHIRQRFKIFILSSSVDHYDKQKAKNNKLVSGYIEKPLTISAIQNFFVES